MKENPDRKKDVKDGSKAKISMWFLLLIGHEVVTKNVKYNSDSSETRDFLTKSENNQYQNFTFDLNKFCLHMLFESIFLILI